MNYYLFRLTSLVFILLFSTEFSFSQQDTLYSFFIAGHTYGKAGVDNIGLHPPFKDKFDYINNRTEIKLGVLTGDIVFLPSETDWDEVDDDVNDLNLPVYFAVGNHDMKDRALYENRYGSTYFHFLYENDLFLILDPNIDQWNISGEQFIYMQNVVDSLYPTVDNIFVFTHQVLWKENDNKYRHIRLNSNEGRASEINFWSEIEPYFNSLPNHVIFCAGDMGAASWSDDFMYDSYGNITLICSGMGEGVGDNFVVLNIMEDKSIDYDLICLNETDLNCFGDLTDYSISNINDYATNDIHFSVYPNPAEDYLKIDSSTPNASIQIISSQSEILFEQNNVDEQIDVSLMNKGIYIIKLISKEGIATQKFVKL